MLNLGLLVSFKVGHNAGSLKIRSAIALCRKYKQLLETELGPPISPWQPWLVDWQRQHHTFRRRRPQISEDNYITGWIRDPHTNCMDEAEEVQLEKYSEAQEAQQVVLLSKLELILGTS